MLNPANGESVLVVTKYVEEYLDLVESLPLDLQRCVSLMREIDGKYQEVLKELNDFYERHQQGSDPVVKRRLLHCIQRSLIRAQELGDEKIQIAGQMVELVENRSRQFEWQVELFQACQSLPDSTVSVGSTSSPALTTVTVTPLSTPLLSVSKPSIDRKREETPGSVEKSGAKRARRQKSGSENRDNTNYSLDLSEEVSVGTPKEKKPKISAATSAKKRKRTKSKQEREASPTDLPIDPNEPTYCLCEQVSYGEMICCDNDKCPIEWFHFSCVGLHHKPKGKWYCPKCRGENEKTMDKALGRSRKERVYNR
ncbi:inhibitor of growth protein 1-like [Astyanax mexicanus]|uniref:Inhibitor of growth protein n=1 Tax=Astyanax mexicanus TaxID=7994 RepID=A0A8B9L2Z9_ASTMX|nr:inhibitor of growth protein 1-like [Astyanax mexicanus]